MNQIDVAAKMKVLFEHQVMPTREDGQKEYASGNNAFSNFIKLGEELDMDPKAVLWVYAMKHKDGIASHLRGNTSQREDVTGRIKDLIVYLFLLWCMIEEDRVPCGAQVSTDPVSFFMNQEVKEELVAIEDRQHANFVEGLTSALDVHFDSHL